jgi:hypothetical protein
MLLSHHQNEGRNRDIKVANRSFENVSQLKYLGVTAINQNLIQKEIKIYKSIILSVDLYWCEAWSLTLREEHRVRIFENRVLRRIFVASLGSAMTPSSV